MSQTNEVLHHRNKQEYLTHMKDIKERVHSRRNEATKDVKTPEVVSEKDKVDISEGAKKLAKELINPPTLPDVPKNPFSNISPGARDTTLDELEASAVRQLEHRNQFEGKEVIFINGITLFENMKENGLQKMADNIKNAKHFSWSDKQEIKEHLQALPADKKIVLVGYGLGADTAIDVAKELNQLENKHQRIDLLITLDSMGINNQIVPSNVKKNLNYFSRANDWMVNGPKMAEFAEKTQVQNEIINQINSEISKTKAGRIYDSVEVQKKLMDVIGL